MDVLKCSARVQTSVVCVRIFIHKRAHVCVCVYMFFSFSILYYYIVDRLQLLANVPAATQLRQLPQTISRRYCPNECNCALNNIMQHEIMFKQKCLKDLCIANWDEDNWFVFRRTPVK